MLRSTKPPRCMPSFERIRAVIRYNQDSGDFVWLSKGRGHRPGDLAGRLRHDGYRIISIDGHACYAHRLAWLLVHGRVPDNVDHIDGNPRNNRLSNLREVTKSQNSQNLKRPHFDNESGYLGVQVEKSTGRFKALICHQRRRHWLGRFDTAEEAHQAYLAAKRRIHECGTL